MSTHVLLLAPGLFDRRYVMRDEQGLAELGESLTALEDFLTRGRQIKSSYTHQYQAVRALLNLTPDQTLASLAYLHDTGAVASGQPYASLLCADPVTLQADRDCVVMLGQVVQGLSTGLAGQFIDLLNQHFADQPWSFSAPTANRWYCHLEQPPQIATVSIAEAVGCDLKTVMPTGPDERVWRGIMNEIQMLLHDCAMNQQLSASGYPQVNGLWFWGGAEYPAPASTQYDAVRPAKIGHIATVFSDDPVVLGAARLQSCDKAAYAQVTRLWSSAEGRADTPTEAGLIKYLIDYNGFLNHNLMGSTSHWQNQLVQFNQSCLWPLYQLIRAKLITRLTLIPCNGFAYELEGGRHHWWRRRRSIKEFYPD